MLNQARLGAGVKTRSYITHFKYSQKLTLVYVFLYFIFIYFTSVWILRGWLSLFTRDLKFRHESKMPLCWAWWLKPCAPGLTLAYTTLPLSSLWCLSLCLCFEKGKVYASVKPGARGSHYPVVMGKKNNIIFLVWLDIWCSQFWFCCTLSIHFRYES